MFNTVYGHPAPTFFDYIDEEGNHCVKVILSQTGTRMGCPAGSLGFDMAQHHFILEPLIRKYCTGDGATIIQALTDDVCPAFKGPGEQGTQQEWEELYDRVASFLHDYDTLANRVGIKRNSEKSKLLIPPHAPDPINKPRGDGNIVLKPNRSGIVSAGIPVGTDAFRIQEVASANF